MSKTTSRCETCATKIHYLGMARHRAMHYHDTRRSFAATTIVHVADADCPRCGFPEQLITRDAKTNKILRRQCSSSECKWTKKI